MDTIPMSLSYQPFADTPSIIDLERDLRMNVPDPERAISAAAGAALVVSAVGHRSGFKWLFLLAGAALVRRGLTGHCPWYQRRGIDRRHPVRSAGGEAVASGS